MSRKSLCLLYVMVALAITSLPALIYLIAETDNSVCYPDQSIFCQDRLKTATFLAEYVTTSDDNQFYVRYYFEISQGNYCIDKQIIPKLPDQTPYTIGHKYDVLLLENDNCTTNIYIESTSWIIRFVCFLIVVVNGFIMLLLALLSIYEYQTEKKREYFPCVDGKSLL